LAMTADICGPENGLAGRDIRRFVQRMGLLAQQQDVLVVQRTGLLAMVVRRLSGPEKRPVSNGKTLVLVAEK
jgi:hypothetical protein